MEHGWGGVAGFVVIAAFVASAAFIAALVKMAPQEGEGRFASGRRRVIIAG
jgi:hypothetical protein